MQESLVMTAEDVAAALRVSVPMAYIIIRQLNQELQEMGKITVRGRINRRYFEKKMEV